MLIDKKRTVASSFLRCYNHGGVCTQTGNFLPSFMPRHYTRRAYLDPDVHTDNEARHLLRHPLISQLLVELIEEDQEEEEIRVM